GTNFQQVGLLDPGEVFLVTNGPICDTSFTWWEIRYEGQTYWTAEGTAGDYFLEPVAEGAPVPGIVFPAVQALSTGKCWHPGRAKAPLPCPPNSPSWPRARRAAGWP
ncbi:MAG: hypothetical protein HC915_19740, partial [Anaerolineae bacterium]|nr:hypothetical protein [Anaerolineae bacterium]